MATAAGAAQKQAIRELHDIGLVDGVNLLALVLAGVLESETRNASGRFLGDDLQALDHAGDNFVLDAGVKALRVFAHDDQVDVRITGRNVRQVANGTEVGIELKLLAAARR